MNWPNDADGDVLRRMKAGGFDFSKPTVIDFDVDFEDWPAPEAALALLRKSFPSTKVYGPTDDDEGYVLFQIYENLSYELVINIQAEVSLLMAPYGGICESWGVLY